LISEQIVSTQSGVSVAIAISDVLDVSANDIATEQFELTDSAVVSQVVVGTVDVSFFASVNLSVTELNAAAQPSDELIGTANLISTRGVLVTAGFAGSTEVGASSYVDISRDFALSDDFTASVFFGEDARGQGAGKGYGGKISASALAGAGAGAVAGLLLVVGGVVFALKRYRRNIVTDLGMEYEAEAKGVDLQDSESGEEQDEDWDVHDFERAIESAFDDPTQVAPDVGSQPFPSDCDELF
jgi:hypothetical protein